MTQDKEELIELYEAFSIEEIEERLELNSVGCCCICKCHANSG